MKKGVLFFILGIFLINFVSAFNGYSNYFDSSLITYGAIFVIFFAMLNFILGRTIFRENKGSRIIISLASSLLAVYGLATSNFNVGGGYVGSFYVGEYLLTILGVILIAGIIYFLSKWGFANALIVLGLLLIGISLTNLVYEKGVVLVFGIILLVIGLILLFKRPKWKISGWKTGEREADYGDSGKRQRRKREKNIREFGIKQLIEDAKHFKKVAIRLARRKRKTPRFYRNWAHFIEYLKRKYHRSNERDICNTMNVNHSDIIKVVRKYIR